MSEKTEKFCQSCGIPFKKIEHGTEKDWTESLKYCKLCYQNGEFVEKDVTFEQMVERGQKGLETQEMWSFKKKILIKYYPKFLSGLERWKSLFEEK